MFYVTYSDDEHEGPMDWFDSLFEATCSYYELLTLLEDNEAGELGSMESHPDDANYGELDDDWICLVYSSPEDRFSTT
jgi:hypothetical protein